jgi:hypothetical protein
MKYKIIGYTNPLESNAAPIITIGKSMNAKYFAFFPDNTNKELAILHENQIFKLDTFIPEKKDIYINSGEYSYLNAEDEIITGNPSKLTIEIRKDLLKLKSTDFEHYEFLNNIYLDELKTLNIKDVLLFTTERTKKNGELAKRLHIQFRKNNSFRPAYKKNLYSNEPLKNQDESRFISQVNNTLLNLSKRFKESNIINLYKNVA